MIEENEVNIQRNKRALEKLREEKANASRSNEESGTGISNGHVESRDDSNGRTAQGNIGSLEGTERGASGTGEIDLATEGLRSGVRPPDRPDVNATQSARQNNGRRKENLKAVPQPEPVETKAKFVLKNPFEKLGQGSAKLFTKQEAQDETERMAEIYSRGSALLDDIIEITVKDHEPVVIWQLSDEEATMLASLHLERATKDIAAARSARKLLEIYDRLYFWLLVVPRIKATGDHVQAHKGFSFK